MVGPGGRFAPRHLLAVTAGLVALAIASPVITAASGEHGPRPALPAPPAAPPPVPSGVVEAESTPIAAASLGARPFAPLPPGLDPVTASAATLDAYGLPPRPIGAGGATWIRAMQRAVRLVTPGFRVHRGLVRAPPAQSPQGPGNWAGLVASQQSPYTRVSGEFNNPQITVPDGTNRSVGVWVGLGTGTKPADDLSLQLGTEEDQRGKAQVDYPWWAGYPFAGDIVISGLPAASSQTMFASIGWSGTTATFFLENESTGSYTAFSVGLPPGGCPCRSAEWIVDRPAGADTPPMAWFNWVTFAFATATGRATVPLAASSVLAETAGDVVGQDLARVQQLPGGPLDSFTVNRTSQP